MTIHQAASFAIAAGILTLLPGSDTLLVLRNTLLHGRTTGLVVTAGICSGLFVHASASALGMSAIVRLVPHGFVVLQALGAAYLGFLGLRSLSVAFRGSAGDPSEASSRAVQRRGGAKFLEGFLANVLNPKAMVFYIALLPQFLAPTDPVWSTSLQLTCIHIAEGLAWLGFLAVALDRVRPFLLHPRTLRAMEAVSGILLVGFCLRLAFVRI
jgi:threonine/homoserine/homoserine lactone efflux protein